MFDDCTNIIAEIINLIRQLLQLLFENVSTNQY